jgi:hypothetical protein
MSRKREQTRNKPCLRLTKTYADKYYTTGRHYLPKWLLLSDFSVANFLSATHIFPLKLDQQAVRDISLNQ